MKPITVLISLFWMLLGSATALAETRPVTLFAASSMTNAVDEIVARYQQLHAATVLTSYAASSSLARQIAAGAPADIYISANQRWMDYLEQQQALLPDSRQPLTGNQLVLIGGLTAPPMALADLPQRLQYERLAVADPDHVPAGIYTRQALQSLALWQGLQSRLASAQNVRVALLLVERGEAPLGIVYNTDALLSDKVQILRKIPGDLHTPIIYPIARTRSNHPESEALWRFFMGPEARAILRKYGFTAPVIHAQ